MNDMNKFRGYKNNLPGKLDVVTNHVSETIPGEAITIRQLFERYQRGMECRLHDYSSAEYPEDFAPIETGDPLIDFSINKELLEANRSQSRSSKKTSQSEDITQTQAERSDASEHENSNSKYEE